MTGIFAIDFTLQVIGIWSIAAVICLCIWAAAMRRRDRIDAENRRIWKADDCHHPRYSGHGFE